jgi:hypothetical protein
VSSMPSSESLSCAVMTLLADAAFVLAEPTTTSLPASEKAIVSRLTIEHGETWELCVCVQDKLGQILAANLLGDENESGEAGPVIADAVGELSNILAGAIAVEIFGKDEICHIAVPEVDVQSGTALAAHLAKSTFRLNFLTEEGYALSVALTARGES